MPITLPLAEWRRADKWAREMFPAPIMAILIDKRNTLLLFVLRVIAFELWYPPIDIMIPSGTTWDRMIRYVEGLSADEANAST